jgi:hypothetical protein
MYKHGIQGKLISKHACKGCKDGYWPCSGHGIQENGSGLYMLAAHALEVWLFLIPSIKSQGNGYSSVNNPDTKILTVKWIRPLHESNLHFYDFKYRCKRQEQNRVLLICKLTYIWLPSKGGPAWHSWCSWWDACQRLSPQPNISCNWGRNIMERFSYNFSWSPLCWMLRVPANL